MPNCCSRKKKVQGDRSFIVGERGQAKFASNGISTTRYNPVTFLPLSLLLQFSRYANIYFLINAILQSIPSISPLAPISAIAPLIFVIALSMLREGFEDFQRYRSDLETNNSETAVSKNGRFETVKWKEVQVGDLVRVKADEFFPADLIVLGSSDPKGSCFIMTSPLDGEKNLKPRFALSETQQYFGQGGSPSVRISVSCGPPTQDLGDFSGSLEIGSQKIGLSAKQLMLRGAKLSNTDWIIGTAVYTGLDTKIMNNSDEPRIKQSNLERMMNRFIIGLILLQFVMCLITFVGAWIWNSWIPSGYSYFVQQRGSSFSEAVLVFFTMWVLLNSMIPISLIISLEMVKLVQAYLMEKDIDMYDPVEQRYMKTVSSSLNEELGQIQYIFTDKTGTLTSNVMEFKYCQAAGTFFGNEGFLTGKVVESNPLPLTIEAKQDGVGRPFEDQRLEELLRGKPGDPTDIRFLSQGREIFALRNTSEVAKHFLMTMSVCHECMEDQKKEGRFLGPSPDEVALVASARANGYEFKRTTNSGKVVKVNGREVEFIVLDFFEFSSARKRASVVIRHEGVIKLLSKGADSIIIERLAPDGQPFLAQTKDILSKFSATGLRTLCFAMRVMSEEEWAGYSRELGALAGDPNEKEKKEAVIDRIERGMSLLGCTAVEDKLQDQVPEVIADFLLADIKVWMLTGDKMETAENIGYSCRLIQQNFKKLYLTREEELQSKLEEFSNRLAQKNPQDKYCLIVEGKAILALSKDDDMGEQYVDQVFSKVDSVVCCRMSPKQKGDVVRLVKRFKNKITLAVGDGANDTNMIQEAHIGIGLYGREGLRAVQSSDFALPEFRALWKLIFVHGRWAYLRNAEMILYFYYKNMIFTFPAWLFSFFNGFSGMSLYDDYYITFYNLVFTAFPVIVRAVLDQDIYYRDWAKFHSDSFFERNMLFELDDVRVYYPHLYYVGQLNLSFKLSSFLIWISAGIVSAIVLFFFLKEVMLGGIAVAGGKTIGLWFFSIVVYTSVIFAVSVKIMVFTRNFTWLNLIAVLVMSLLLYTVYFFIADLISSFRIFRTALAIVTSPITYFGVLFLVLLFFMGDLLYLVTKRETQTPLYLMFRSLEEEKHDLNKLDAYNALVYDVQQKLLAEEERRVQKEDFEFRQKRKTKKRKDKSNSERAPLEQAKPHFQFNASQNAQSLPPLPFNSYNGNPYPSIAVYPPNATRSLTPVSMGQNNWNPPSFQTAGGALIPQSLVSPNTSSLQKPQPSFPGFGSYSPYFRPENPVQSPSPYDSQQLNSPRTQPIKPTKSEKGLKRDRASYPELEMISQAAEILQQGNFSYPQKPNVIPQNGHRSGYGSGPAGNNPYSKTSDPSTSRQYFR